MPRVSNLQLTTDEGGVLSIRLPMSAREIVIRGVDDRGKDIYTHLQISGNVISKRTEPMTTPAYEEAFEQPLSSDPLLDTFKLERVHVEKEAAQ